MSKMNERELIARCYAGEKIVFLDDDYRPGTLHHIGTLLTCYAGNEVIYRNSSRYTLEEGKTRLRELGYGFFCVDGGSHSPL